MFCMLTFPSKLLCHSRNFNGHTYLNLLSYNKIVSDTQLLNILYTMPKMKKEQASRAKSQEEKEDSSKSFTPGTVLLQVIGSGAVGAPKSVYLFSDQNRYLFNCGEGTQRLSHEHKVKLSKLEHIFITTSTWDSIGGLPGASLTLQDCGVSEISLHGPPGLTELYEATSRFVVMKNLKVKMAKCQPYLPYEDAVMSVSYVPLMKEGTGSYKSFLESEQNDKIAKEQMSRRSDSPNPAEFDNTDYYLYEHKNRSGSPDTGKKEIEDSAAFFRKPKREQICSMAYICRLKDRLGKLDLQKCVDLGVKPGPMLGQLKNGNDVVLKNGQIIRANDVREPDDAGQIFIVLDVPDENYLDSLLTEKLFHEFRSSITPGQSDDKLPAIIIHFSPNSVVQDERYQLFMQDFTPYTKHLFINDSNSCLGSLAVHKIQQQLHLLHENIFPMIRECSIPVAPSDNSLNSTKQLTTAAGEIHQSNEFCNQLAAAHFQRLLRMEDTEMDGELELPGAAPNMIQGRTMTTFHLRPKNGFDNQRELKLQYSHYIAEVMSLKGFSDTIKQFKEDTDQFNSEEPAYPKFVFLGTGSCIPNKTRNTSSILVHVSENTCILLDCGEGTYGQIMRFYGPTLADKVLDKMKAIYISHLHADHHIGLIGVLQGRRKAFNRLHKSHRLPLKKIYLLAPNQILPWLNFYDKRFENISLDYEIISNTALLQSEGDNSSFPTYIPKILEMTNIQTCFVKHCPNAFGIALTIGDQKITYSGDTIPCEDLVKLGKNSKLLIHEATMEDELAQQARMKMHSTTSQAITVGNKMNAEHIILTHFSQRYARIPRLKNLKLGVDLHNVGVAFDNMQVSLNQLRILPYMVKPLELIFTDQCQLMDQRAEKRKHLRSEIPDRSKDYIKTASRSFSPVTSQSQTNRSETADESEMASSRPVPVLKGEYAVRKLVRSASRTLTTSAFTQKEIWQRPQKTVKVKKKKPKVAEIKAPIRAITVEDSKKKFRSRKYWEESKFEKIEGLNWISWKK